MANESANRLLHDFPEPPEAVRPVYEAGRKAERHHIVTALLLEAERLLKRAESEGSRDLAISAGTLNAMARRIHAREYFPHKKEPDDG